MAEFFGQREIFTEAVVVTGGQAGTFAARNPTKFFPLGPVVVVIALNLVSGCRRAPEEVFWEDVFLVNRRHNFMPGAYHP